MPSMYIKELATLVELTPRRLYQINEELDEEKNSGCREGTISSTASAVRVSVIPANEELGVARQTYGYIEKMEG